MLAIVLLVIAGRKVWEIPRASGVAPRTSFIAGLAADGVGVGLATLALTAPLPLCLAMSLRRRARTGGCDPVDDLVPCLAGLVVTQCAVFLALAGSKSLRMPALVGAEAIVLLAGLATLPRELVRGAARGRDFLGGSVAYLFVAASLAAFGAASVHIGQDFNWDLKNYHYYNGYSFINERIKFDYALVNEQTYFNPALDAIFYLLAESLPPVWVGFVMGAAHGVAFVLAIAIASNVLGLEPSIGPRRSPLALSCGVAGACEPAFLAQLGTTFHDNLLASFVLASVLLLLGPIRRGRRWEESVPTLVAAGVLMGAAAGFKLTTATFAVGATVALALGCGRAQSGAVSASAFASGLMLGFLASNGYWMARLYADFESPIFPLYNKIFKSPYYAEINWTYLRDSSENTWARRLLLPFLFARDQRVASEVSSRDLRFAVAYLLLSAVLVARAIDAVRARRSRPGPTFRPSDRGGRSARAAAFLTIFATSSYIVWQHQFWILRYLVPLSILAPLLCALLASSLLGRRAPVAAQVVFVAIVGWVTVPNYGHVPWTRTYLDLKLPDLRDDEGGIVLVDWRSADLEGRPAPLACVAAGFPRRFRFIKAESPMYRDRAGALLKMGAEVEDAIRRHEGPLYLLTHQHRHPLSPLHTAILDRYNLDLERQEPRPVTANSLSLSLWRLSRRSPEESLRFPRTTLGARACDSDYDGDGHADLLAFAPTTNRWIILDAGDGRIHTESHAGTPATAEPIPADYDGDGRADLAAYDPRSATFFIWRSGAGGDASRAVGPGWSQPVPADYDGDGRADLAAYDPLNATFHVHRSSDEQAFALPLGGPGNVPVPADYDGDGRADLAVYWPQGARFYIRSSRSGEVRTALIGGPCQSPAPFDHDGDGKVDAAVFDPSAATWTISESRSGVVSTIRFGQPGAQAAPRDTDGDGRADVSTFDPATGVWNILQSGRDAALTRRLDLQTSSFATDSREVGGDARPSGREPVRR